MADITDTTENTGNWFSKRFGNRIDRVWVGGLVLVSVVVWGGLGSQYIATCLIGYYFVFTLRLHRQIKESFPPTNHFLYSDVSGVINPHVSANRKINRARIIAVVPLLTMHMVAWSIDWENIFFTVAAGGIWATNLIIYYFFLVRHKETFSAFSGDCLIFQRTGNDDGGQTNSVEHFPDSCVIFFQILRPAGAIALAIFCWIWLLWASMNGVLIFDEHRHAFIMPMIINLGLFLIIQCSLISLGKKL